MAGNVEAAFEIRRQIEEYVGGGLLEEFSDFINGVIPVLTDCKNDAETNGDGSFNLANPLFSQLCDPVSKVDNVWKLATALLPHLHWETRYPPNARTTTPMHSLAKMPALPNEFLGEVTSLLARSGVRAALSTLDEGGDTPLSVFIKENTNKNGPARLLESPEKWMELLIPKRDASAVELIDVACKDTKSLSLAIQMLAMNGEKSMDQETTVKLVKRVIKYQSNSLQEPVFHKPKSKGGSLLCPMGILVEVWRYNKDKNGGTSSDKMTEAFRDVLHCLLEEQANYNKKNPPRLYKSKCCGCLPCVHTHHSNEQEIDMEHLNPGTGRGEVRSTQNQDGRQSPASHGSSDASCCCCFCDTKEKTLTVNENYRWKAKAFDQLVSYTQKDMGEATLQQYREQRGEADAGRSSLLLSPLNRAIEYGLTEFVDVCIEQMKPDPEGGPDTYDVTNFLPSTMQQSQVDLGIRDRQPTLVESALFWSQWDLLLKSPLDALLRSHWWPYRLIYNLLLIIHILNMICVSHWTMQRYGEQQDVHSEKLLKGVGTIWPLTLLVVTLGQLIAVIRQKPNPLREIFHQLINHTLSLLEESLYKLAGLAFSLTWLAWLLTQKIELLSISLVVGWISSLQYYDGMRKVHHYNIAFRRMLVRDITRFALIVAGLIIGFGCAIFVLTRGSCVLVRTITTPGEALLFMFRWAIGTADFFELPRNTTEARVCSDDGSMVTYGLWAESHLYTLRVFYVVFMLLLNLTFLNMLIAVLTNSFAAAEENKKKSWLCISIQTAVQTEQLMAMTPCVRTVYFCVVRCLMPKLRAYRLGGGEVRYLFNAAQSEARCNSCSFSKGCGKCEVLLRLKKKFRGDMF